MAIPTPSHFDYLTHARAAGLNDDQICALVERWRLDYASDQHLLELRLLRVASALESGAISYDQAMAPEDDTPPEFVRTPA